jgi:hypothetical protein
MKITKLLAALAVFVVTTVLVTIALIQSNVVTKIAENSAIGTMQQEVNLMVQSLQDDAAISITEEIGREIRSRYTASVDLRFIFVDIDKAWKSDPSLTEKFGMDNVVLKYKLASNSLSDEVLKKISEVKGTPSFDYIKEKVVSSSQNNMWGKTEKAIGEVETMISEKYLPLLPEIMELQEKLNSGIAPTVEDAQFVEYILAGLPTLLDARFDILHNGTINPSLGLSVTELDGSMHDAKVARSATRPDLVKYNIAFDYNQSVEAINAIDSAKNKGVFVYMLIACLFALVSAVIVWKKASAKEANDQEIKTAEENYKKLKKVAFADEDLSNASENYEQAGKELTAAKEKLATINEEIEVVSQKAIDEDNKVEVAKQKVADAKENLKNNSFSQELARKQQELVDNTIANSEIAAATDFAKDEQELKEIDAQLASVSDGSQLIKKVSVIREHAEHTFAKKIPLKTMVQELETASAKIGNFNLHSLINKLKDLPKTMRKPDAEKQKFAAEVVETCNNLEKELSEATLKLGTLQARKEEIEKARETLGAERIKQLKVLSEKVNKCYILEGEINELEGRVEDLQAGPEEANAKLNKVLEEATNAKAEIEQDLNALVNQRIEATANITSAELKVETTKAIFKKALERSNALKESSKSFSKPESDETEESEKAENSKQLASDLLTKVGAIWNSIPNFHKKTISCIAGALVVLVAFF